jgi:hypothetical protein
MCRAKNGELLTKKDQDLGDDGVEIDLPNREEIEGALKYLKNNGAAGSDSISDELLKNGGPNLVNALHELIKQVWTSKTLPESWTSAQERR